MSRRVIIGALLVTGIGIALTALFSWDRVASAQTVALAAPSPWSASAFFSLGTEALIAGPSRRPINITSISVSGPSGNRRTLEFIPYVFNHARGKPQSCPPASANFLDPNRRASIWGLVDATEPFSVAFPTPLQIPVPRGKAICLRAWLLESEGTSISNSVALNVSGT